MSIRQIKHSAAIIVICAAAALAGASEAAPAHRSSMTCREFLSLDEVTRPKVVYWAEGLNHKGNPEDAVVDIDATDRLVPVLVDQCRVAPQASFWDKLKASWNHFEASLRDHL